MSENNKPKETYEKITVAYIRVSSPKQQLKRQEKNIKQHYPNAYIIQDKYTGTSLDRPGLSKLLQMCDGRYLPKNTRIGTIVVDEISRLSRDEVSGFELYKSLYNKGIEFVSLKEPHLSTQTYRAAMQKCINLNDINTGSEITDNLISSILKALNAYTLELANKQIKDAFAVAQKERDYLSQRTKEGMLIAKLNGKRIGRPTGTKIDTKKYKAAKKKIKKYYKKFGGSLSAMQTAKLCNISKSTFYEYLKKIDAENNTEINEGGFCEEAGK